MRYIWINSHPLFHMFNTTLSPQFWVLPLPKWDKSDVTLSVEALAHKQSLEHLDWSGKRVLMRVDYNVPVKDGKVTDPARVDATIDTLKHILEYQGPNGGVKCLTLICHMGRPGGKFNREDFSLRPVVEVLRNRLGDLAPVRFLDDCVGPVVESEINNCAPGTVFLCENLRFHIEETGSSKDAHGNKVKAESEAVERFRKALSSLGDVFVFEAFGAAHRPHSSVSGISIPQRVSGLLMQKELSYFAKILSQPDRPFLAIIGGAKVSDKIQVLENLIDICDEMIITGGMAYTFKKVLDGLEIGSSLFDEAGAGMVQTIVKRAKEKGVLLHFPVDHVIADNFSPDANVRVVDDAEGIEDGWMALDIGPKSRELNSAVMARAKTILWNGPMGVFEFPAFAKGTEQGMVDMVLATKRGCTTIIGGGDTGAASMKFKVDGTPVAKQISHCSTGGGSSLVLMEGKMLPGVDSLSDIQDKPPKIVDTQRLWLEVEQLKKENSELKKQLKANDDGSKSSPVAAAAAEAAVNTSASTLSLVGVTGLAAATAGLVAFLLAKKN